MGLLLILTLAIGVLMFAIGLFIVGIEDIRDRDYGIGLMALGMSILSVLLTTFLTLAIISEM